MQTSRRSRDGILWVGALLRLPAVFLHQLCTVYADSASIGFPFAVPLQLQAGSASHVLDGRDMLVKDESEDMCRKVAVKHAIWLGWAARCSWTRSGSRARSRRTAAGAVGQLADRLSIPSSVEQTVSESI